MEMSANNFDPKEIGKFEAIAQTWWDPKGPFRGLHDMNPLRLKYISDRTEIKGKNILDIGCGGGILCESLAEMEGHVTGIDLNSPALDVANEHAEKKGLSIDFHNISTEDFAVKNQDNFDIVVCMEMLEHVPDPYSIILSAKKMVKPGGHVYFSTINKTFRSYLLAIIISEYVLNLLEKKTHNFKKFIKPILLRTWGEAAGLTFLEVSGIFYFPYIPICRLSQNTDVNYLMHFTLEN